MLVARGKSTLATAFGRPYWLFFLSWIYLGFSGEAVLSLGTYSHASMRLRMQQKVHNRFPLTDYEDVCILMTSILSYLKFPRHKLGGEAALG